MELNLPVSTRTASRIDRVVDDLIAGRNVDAIQSEPDTPFASEPGPSSCCEHFLGFLEGLRVHMVLPHVYSVSHERALMLLYDYQFDQDFEQPFLRLWVDRAGRRYLISKREFHDRFAQRAAVRIWISNDATDPSVFDRGWSDSRAEYLKEYLG